MAMIEIGKNEIEAKENCIRLSEEHKGMYVYAYAAFGLYATISQTLSVFAPSDSIFDWYALNGKVKQFTASQKMSDQNATPMMN